jgi:hypothetical protein
MRKRSRSDAAIEDFDRALALDPGYESIISCC